MLNFIGRFGRPAATAMVIGTTILASAERCAFGQATISGAPPAATAKSTTAAAAPTVDAKPIEVPNGKPSELLEFIDKVKAERSTATDYPSILAHVARVQEAVISAADKIAAASPTEPEATRAINDKISALMMLGRTGSTEAEGRLKTYIDELLKDSRPFVPPLAKIYQLGTRLQKVDRNNPAELEPLIADVREHARTSKPDLRNLSLAFQAARLVEQANDKKLAGELYREFAAVFAKSDDAQVVDRAKKLEGAARLIELPGSAIEVTGKQLDGKPLDWKSYQGKTVLVDFWATWCGPCVAELPNIKDAYAKYHERGFDVVAISLDTDKQRVDDFVKRESLPWAVLYSDDPAAAGWNHPLANYYGIMAIPRAILVDKDGKVASTSARGEELWDLLRDRLGPPVEKKPAEGDAAVPDDKTPKEKPAGAKPEGDKPASDKP